jgi:hypothetical protein
MRTQLARFSALAICVAALSCDGLTDPNGPTWQEISTDGVPARWGHVAVYDPKRDRMVVFGGDGLSLNEQAEFHDTAQRNDVWALDMTTLAWSRLPATNAPTPRTDLAAVLDADRDRLVVIGGRVGFASSIDEVWAYSFADGSWKQLQKGPSARHDIPAATDGKKAWVFGGAGGFLQSLDDLWELDLASETWTQLPEPGARPAARTSGALEFYQGALYLSGGHDATKVQRDSWRYDLAAQSWQKLGESGELIGGAHFGHALDVACASLMFSAGDNLDNYNVAFTDGLVLGASPRITILKTSNLPPPRDHPSMIMDAKRRRLVLYGGGSLGDGLGTRGDAWILPLAGCL